MCQMSFMFFGRDSYRLPTGRTDKQMFGHVSVRIGPLVFDCNLGGETVWYDAEEYMTTVSPFCTMSFWYDGVVTRVSRSLVSGLKYDLRGTAREIKDRVEYPTAVTCVWGARELFRNMGMECNVRTPDQLYQWVLRLQETLREAGSSISGLRARGVEFTSEGITPDSVFDREGRRSSSCSGPVEGSSNEQA